MKERVRELTPRHREVVQLICLGCTMSVTAAILDLETSTVDNHRHAAMRTMGVSKAATLPRLAITNRISLLDDRLTPGENRKLARKA